MNKFWMMCGLLVLLGCQKEETPPAKPVAKIAPVVKGAPAERASAKPAAKEAAPLAVTPAPAQVNITPGPAATDAAVLELARKSNCFACHALDKKVVGPAWKAVAAKYRGDTNAQRYLENKIAKGGGGVWGGAPMPAQPKLSPEQRAQLARFILDLQ
ncbi:MAG: hypothetical protein Fur0026_12810 [Sideroxydans sp.]